jgi:hypothetical protein
VIATGTANRAPVASDASVSATSGVAAAWTPSVSDPDGDTLSCSIVSQPAHGSASVAADCSSGSYTSTAGYSGPDSFTYKATDPSNADSPPATVNATVGTTNRAPVALDRSVSATSGVAAAWTPSVSDPDGDTLSCSIVSQPAHGSASVAADCSSGSYTSTAGYSGPDSFTYKATDPSNADSPPATVNATVTAGSSSGTFNPAADAYVTSSSATTNFGTQPTLRVDASPDTLTYLRFNVTGVVGTVSQATLRVYANSNQTTGYDAFGVSDTLWLESGPGSINYSNRPMLAATKTGSSGPITAAPRYTSVDVTPLVTGNGPVALALRTTSVTALSLASREAANRPELIVQSTP